MKQEYTAAELQAQIALLQNVFDSVRLVDPHSMQFLDTATLEAVGPCHSLPELDARGRGWQPVRLQTAVELALFQSVTVEGRWLVLLFNYALPQSLPENSREANAFLRILAQYSEELRHDYVTGAYNQRFLTEEYVPALAERVAAGERLSLALARVNEYGRICADCGSEAGDRCLNTAAGILHIAAGMDPRAGILARLEDGVFLVTAFNTPATQLEKTLCTALDCSRRDYNISLSRRGEFTVTVAAADWAETGNWELLLALAERRLFARQ